MAAADTATRRSTSTAARGAKTAARRGAANTDGEAELAVVESSEPGAAKDGSTGSARKPASKKPAKKPAKAADEPPAEPEDIPAEELEADLEADLDVSPDAGDLAAVEIEEITVEPEDEPDATKGPGGEDFVWDEEESEALRQAR
ncbi:MAG: RNA polymerase sigma factor, partial [Pseudonocardiaceae bacterium]